MDRTQLSSVQVGPYSENVKNTFRLLLANGLLHFSGQLSLRYRTIQELDEARFFSNQEHENGLTWLELREHEDAYATCGGSFLHQQPWQAVTESIRSFYRLLDGFINEHLPKHLRQLYDDVFADLRSCFRCLIFRGSFDGFHTMLWEAYSQGGWPCGWFGDIVEQEDGSYDISRAVIYVYWEKQAG